MSSECTDRVRQTPDGLDRLVEQHIMIIGGGILQIPAIQTAKEMGLTTIVTDYNKEAYGLKLADFPIVMSTKDIEGSVRVARAFNDQIKINGVFTVGTDASMTVAAVAAALNLPGIKFDNALAATNKLKMRQRFKTMGVPSPEFFGCWTLDEAVEAFHQLKAPVVIKPTTNMGARGVKRVDELKDLEEAFQSAKMNSPSGEIIIEEYMEGSELSIDALIFNSKIYIAGIADRIIQYEPYFVETGHILPSNQPSEIISEAISVMKQGIRALDIEMGAAKGDIKITKSGVKFVELAARLSGGFMSAYTYPYATGVNLIQNAILIALGQEPEDLTPKYHRVSMERGLIPKSGIVKSITGVEEGERVKGVKNIFLNVQEGDVVKDPTNNIEKSGHIIVVGETREEAARIIDEAYEKIKIDTAKEGKITYNEIRTTALKKFNKTCFVCKICDGRECKGQVPGMGGIGTAGTFFNNLKALQRYQVITSYLHDVKDPQMRTRLFGANLSFPVLVSPITGTETNMGGGLTEIDFIRGMMSGAQLSGTLSMAGDGASPDKYLDGVKGIKEVGGRGIPIFKPRVDQNEIIKRIRAAEEAGALAVGIDIDAGIFKTMALKGQAVETKSIAKIQELVRSTHLPFILKGVMTKTDALRVLDTGARAIIVSNHGGRVMDSMPGTADVLPEIVDVIRREMVVMVDGGFRTGLDVLKGLALGADFVCIGRPVAIGAYGGRERGVKYVLDQFKEELRKAMILTGLSSLQDCHPGILKMTPNYVK